MILIYVEHQNGRLSAPSKGAFTAALALGEQTGWGIAALVAGKQVEAAAKESIALGASKVFVYKHSELAQYRSLPFTRVFLQAIKDHAPELVLFGYSTSSTDFAPRLSVALKSAMLTGATDLTWENKSLIVTKPAFKDKLLFKFAVKTTPRLVILGIGAFAGAKADTSRTGEIITGTPAFEDGDLTEDILGAEVVTKEVDLTEAKLIISGGRGVGSKEKFQIIYDTAAALGGEWASSRAVHDAGWTLTDRHVGQTGQQVAPDVYIASGISGAIQHLAGIKKSKTIIVINTDPEAPIWEVATHGIVGDLHKVLPLIAKKVNEG